jgi:hypothetical protein
VESWGSADENGQESGCGGCGEDHFGIWEGLSWSTPTCAQCHWSGQGNAWGESFAMKYMQRGLKYCEKGHLNLDL